MLKLQHTKEEIQDVINFIMNRNDMQEDQKATALTILECILTDRIDRIICMFKEPM